MCGDDLVRKACGNHQVGFDDFVLKQPRGPDFAAEFLIIGEQQFDAAGLRFGNRFECPKRECIRREITFAHGCRTAIDLTVFNLAAIGIFGPAIAGGDHIAMRIEEHRLARTISAAHHQIGNALQASSSHFGLRHGVFFSVETKLFQELGRALGMRRIVARRCISGYADEFLQKLHLLVKVRVDPGVEFFVAIHGLNSQ